MDSSKQKTQSNEKETSIQIDKNAEENKFPDGGWGWIVAVACGVVRIVKQILQPSFGLIFYGILLKIEASSSTTASIFNLCTILEQLARFFIGPLGDVIGWRKVVITAGLIWSMSTVALIFASSAAHLFIFFSVGVGLSSGIASTTANMVIACYFNKKRGKATAIMLTGVCIGQFGSPILITFLLDKYGYKGTLLIISAITLNVCIAGAVMHPTEWHVKYPTTDVNGIKRKTVSAKSKPIDSSNPPNEELVILTKLKQVFDKILTLNVALLKAMKDNFKALKSYRAVIYSLSLALYMLGYFNFHMMIPFKIQSYGYSLQDAAVCISVMAIFSVFSRIGSPILADMKKFNTKLAYISGYAGLSIALFAFTFAESLRGMIIISSGIGFFNGMILSLYTLSMIDELGITLFKSSYGMSGIMFAINSVTLGPLIGVIRDYSGSYNLSMQLSTGGVLIGLILLLLLPFADKRDRRSISNK